MPLDDTTGTSPTLLRRTADWQDHAAWRDFRDRYEPYFRGWCREYRLEDDLADEVCQVVWVELADKLRSFSYDPRRRFRGWLRTCFHWKAVDLIRRRRRESLAVRSLDGPSSIPLERSSGESVEFDDDGLGPGVRELAVFELAGQVQDAVRARVSAQSWQVFWHIAIDGWTIRETADALDISYVNAFAAHKRVRERLAREGKLRLAEIMGSISDLRDEGP